MTASLFQFLRAYAWPFDDSDEDVRSDGSAFVYWSREGGFAEGQALVFRLDEAGIELAPDAAHPDRRLTVTAAEVDALAGPLEQYLDGEIDHATFIKTHPAAKAILALHHEAQAEADAEEEADRADDGDDD